MKTIFLYSLAWATFASPAFALDTAANVSAPQTDAVAPASLPPSFLELSPQVSILSPTTFVLTRGGNSVPYSGLSGMRTFFLGVNRRVGKVGDFSGYATFRGGFGVKEGVINYTKNGSPRSELIHLDWIPLTLGFKVAYEPSSQNILRPWAIFGSGTQITNQSSIDSDLNQTFWIPHIYGSVGVTFLPSGYRDWFGGFDFGLTYQRSVGTNQVLRGWSFDLAISLLL